MTQDAKKAFAKKEFVSAFDEMARVASRDPLQREPLRCFVSAICSMTAGTDAAATFASTDIVAAFSHAATQQSVMWLANASLSSQSASNGMVSMMQTATTQQSVQCVISALCDATATTRVPATPEMVNALVVLARQTDDAESVEKLSRTMRNITASTASDTARDALAQLWYCRDLCFASLRLVRLLARGLPKLDGKKRSHTQQ